MDAVGKHATGDNEGGCGQGKLSGSHVICGKGGKLVASCKGGKISYRWQVRENT